ncbi:hypothetical protein HanRHA438_Chr17g0829511 [Helianthus annuus]|nr:hypothetical protein HanRHA438_Chr17g0829511 [Helianthus annuus]
MSNSSTLLFSSPNISMSSDRAFDIFAGLWISSAIAHSNVLDVVSVPARNISCQTMADLRIIFCGVRRRGLTKILKGVIGNLPYKIH